MSYSTAQTLTAQSIELLPGYRIHVTANQEYTAECPNCEQDKKKNNLLYWPEKGNFYCRQCHLEGWVNGKAHYDPALIAAMQTKRLADEKIAAQRVSELKKSLESKAAYYHSKVDQGLDYWHTQGLTDETIDRYRLGYSDQCPTARRYASFTIPYTDDGRVVSIRHRLKGKESDKYRPEFSGLGNRVFNGDRLNRTDSFMPNNQVVICEGEVKAMLLDQEGFRVVAFPGATPGHNCLPELVEKLAKFDTVIIALDPNQEQNSRETIAPLFTTKQVIVADLPEKPDDLIVIDYWSADRLYEFMLRGEAVIPPKAKEKTRRAYAKEYQAGRKAHKAKILAESKRDRAEKEALLTPVFSAGPPDDFAFRGSLGLPIIRTKEDYIEHVIPARKNQGKAKDWQEYVAIHYPELDSMVEYDRKLAENKISKIANCGRVRWTKASTGTFYQDHIPCGLCERCKKMDRQNLLDAIFLLRGDLTILTTDDPKERAKIMRQCGRAKVLCRVYPVTKNDGVEYEIIVNKYMPELGEILDPLLLTDDRLNSWLEGAKGNNSSGKLLPSKKDLRKRLTDRLPYQADDNVHDDDCETIVTRNIIPRDKGLKMPDSSIVDNVDSLLSLQAALDVQHKQDVKALINQGVVIFGVSKTNGRYAKNDIPLIILEFNANMARLREAKQQQE